MTLYKVFVYLFFLKCWFMFSCQLIFKNVEQKCYQFLCMGQVYQLASFSPGYP